MKRMGKTLKIFSAMLLLVMGTNIQVLAQDIESESTDPQEVSPDVQTTAIPVATAASVYTDLLLNMPGVIVASTSDVISANYAFMPKVDANTVTTVLGTYSIKAISYVHFSAVDITKMSSGVYYENVGTYHGQPIDMQVTIDDHTCATGQYIDLYTNSMRVSTNCETLNLKYQYFIHNTTTPIAVAGYHNFNDVDLGQYVKLFDDMRVKQVYSQPNSILSYINGANYLQIGDAGNSNTSPSDKKNWVNYTYDETSSFTIQFGTQGGADFYYTYEALVPISTAAPVTVKYLDKDLNPLAPNAVLVGDLGVAYTAQPLNIDGYKLVQVPNNASGVYTESSQEVIFMYEVNTPEMYLLPATGQPLQIGILLLSACGLVFVSRKLSKSI